MGSFEFLELHELTIVVRFGLGSESAFAGPTDRNTLERIENAKFENAESSCRDDSENESIRGVLPRLPLPTNPRKPRRLPILPVTQIRH